MLIIHFQYLCTKNSPFLIINAFHYLKFFSFKEICLWWLHYGPRCIFSLKFSTRLIVLFFSKRFYLFQRVPPELQRENREIFHLLVPSLDGCNGQGWATSKPGTRNLTQVSHVGAGVQELGPYLVTFPRIKSSLDANVHLDGMPVSQIQLNLSFHTEGPSLCFLI